MDTSAKTMRLELLRAPTSKAKVFIWTWLIKLHVAGISPAGDCATIHQNLVVKVVVVEVPVVAAVTQGLDEVSDDLDPDEACLNLPSNIGLDMQSTEDVKVMPLIMMNMSKYRPCSKL